ncbi:somatostatin receptor type 3-like [Diadema antillarum]|uniref:somatostatin receptor type 3-like n=1 Tax=Diadema antillarum TaxID=105358 RepID=UPI003A88B0E5
MENCSNITRNGYWILKEDTTFDIYSYISCVIILVAIVGNTFVIVIQNRLGGARVGGATANRLIIGLALADLLTACFQIPIPEFVNVPNTAAGQFYCRIIESDALAWVCFIASVYTLTTISIERYAAIVHPFTYRIWVHRNLAKYAFILIWLASFIVNLYIIIFRTIDECGECDSVYPYQSSRPINGIFLFLLEYLGPLLVMLYTISRSIVSLRSARLGDDTKIVTSKNNHSRMQQAIHRRLTATFTVVFVAFVVVWTPDQIAFLLHNLGRLHDDFRQSLAYMFLVKLAFLNSSAVNPIIYSFCLPRFRQELKRLLLCRGRQYRYQSDTPEETPSSVSKSVTSTQ